MKHTPGPWKAVNNGPHWNNKAIDNIEIQHGIDGECVVDHVYKLSDANLIAAAPDLLRALEPIANAEKDPTLKGYWRVTDLFVETALVAISKAKGE